MGTLFILARKHIDSCCSGGGAARNTTGQRSRLVDHELARRRENLKTLSDLWAAILSLRPDVTDFASWFEALPDEFNPKRPYPGGALDAIPGEPLENGFMRVIQSFGTKWMRTIQPPLFAARALLQGTPLDKAVEQLKEDIRELVEKQRPLHKTFYNGHKPDIGPMKEKWNDILKQHNEHLELARQHFGLTLNNIERALDR